MKKSNEPPISLKGDLRRRFTQYLTTVKANSILTIDDIIVALWQGGLHDVTRRKVRMMLSRKPITSMYVYTDGLVYVREFNISKILGPRQPKVKKRPNKELAAMYEKYARSNEDGDLLAPSDPVKDPLSWVDQLPNGQGDQL